jgi:hypothetical protein
VYLKSYSIGNGFSSTATADGINKRAHRRVQWIMILPAAGIVDHKTNSCSHPKYIMCLSPLHLQNINSKIQIFLKHKIIHEKFLSDLEFFFFNDLKHTQKIISIAE